MFDNDKSEASALNNKNHKCLKMIKARQVSAWGPPNSDLEYSKKYYEMMLVFSIMDQVER
jgi:hypothetical protein